MYLKYSETNKYNCYQDKVNSDDRVCSRKQFLKKMEFNMGAAILGQTVHVDLPKIDNGIF